MNQVRNPTQFSAPPPHVWWFLWVAMMVSLLLAAWFLPTFVKTAAWEGPLRFLPLFPFVVSAVVRFAVLPRCTTLEKAFPLFIASVALAEACVLLGSFLAPDLRSTWLTLGLMASALHAPFYVRRLLPPRPVSKEIS